MINKEKREQYIKFLGKLTIGLLWFGLILSFLILPLVKSGNIFSNLAYAWIYYTFFIPLSVVIMSIMYFLKNATSENYDNDTTYLKTFDQQSDKKILVILLYPKREDGSQFKLEAIKDMNLGQLQFVFNKKQLDKNKDLKQIANTQLASSLYYTLNYIFEFIKNIFFRENKKSPNNSIRVIEHIEVSKLINFYKQLQTLPELLDQRHVLHRYQAYFEMRWSNSWLKKFNFWLHQDYGLLGRPFVATLLCVVALILLRAGNQISANRTFAFIAIITAIIFSVLPLLFTNKNNFETVFYKYLLDHAIILALILALYLYDKSKSLLSPSSQLLHPLEFPQFIERVSNHIAHIQSFKIQWVTHTLLQFIYWGIWLFFSYLVWVVSIVIKRRYGMGHPNDN